MPFVRTRRWFPGLLAPLAVSVVVACGGGGGSDGGDESSGTTTGGGSTVGVTMSDGSVSLTGTGVTISTTDPTPGDGTCCAARSEAGCSDDPEIAACVCAVDRYCCESTWDAVCGEKVVTFGCGACGTSTSTTVADGTTGTPGENVGPCCAAHPETGCELPTISECVCASEPSCCIEGWDASCVAAIGELGCGVCPPDPTTSATVTTDTGSDTGVPPDNTESCCSPHASTGCEYATIATCVCDPHPECCDTAWDETCIAAVGELGCGVCPPA